MIFSQYKVPILSGLTCTIITGVPSYYWAFVDRIHPEGFEGFFISWGLLLLPCFLFILKRKAYPILRFIIPAILALIGAGIVIRFHLTAPADGIAFAPIIAIFVQLVVFWVLLLLVPKSGSTPNK